MATLHSMLVSLCACLALYELQVAYVDDRAGSLPLPWSRTVEQLKRSGLLKGTVTAGNAWGRPEAVNIFSGSKAVFDRRDHCRHGSGHCRHRDQMGFSGVEQVIRCGTQPARAAVAVPRLSFADKRETPRPESPYHHGFEEVCQVRVRVPLPAGTGKGPGNCSLGRCRQAGGQTRDHLSGRKPLSGP